MNVILSLIVITANILGSFNDPFEFDGNYGEELNPIREYVFEQIVSQEALANNLTDFQIIERIGNDKASAEEIEEYRQFLIAEAIQADLEHGPPLKELVSSEMIIGLLSKQQELQDTGFSEEDIQNILDFLERHHDQKIFSLLRHAPSDLLSLDKILRDKAARSGKDFNLPVVSSTTSLEGTTTSELKMQLLEALFTQENLQITKPQEKLLEALEGLSPDFLQQYLGQDANNSDLAIFTTPAGQVFFYWLYQALNLDLIAQNPEMIAQINQLKQTFAETLGNPEARAQLFKDKLISSNASILFTQESDHLVPQLLTEDGLFHSIEAQNPADGTLVFLRSDIWEPSYQVIAIEDYEGYAKGRLNVILATKTDTGEKFLLASSHGNSTRAEDGRLQITKIKEAFDQLALLPENEGLQITIGIDANTKSEEDVERLHDHLTTLGLISTHVGPTTVKRRMVTVQHSKAGRFAADEEDYIITLNPENGGKYHMVDPTVGFQTQTPDPTVTLPNLDNPSDHYPVGVNLLKS